MKIIKAVQIFTQLFPDEVVTSIDKKRGNEHDVIEINHRWICKSAKTSDKRFLIAREAQLLEALAGKITIAIPKVLYFQEHLLIYEKIAGVPLGLKLCWGKDKKLLDQLSADIALFLYQLHHALPMTQLEALGIPENDWPWFVEKLDQAGKNIDPDLQDAFMSFMKQCRRYQNPLTNISARIQGSSVRKVLLHNDMNFQNIIVDPVTIQLQGIIDFADAAVGDPDLDLRPRGAHDLEVVEGIFNHYEKLMKRSIDRDKIDMYRCATEFSKYFQLLEENKLQAAQRMKMTLRFSQFFGLMRSL